MPKSKEWEINVDGVNYNIIYYPRTLFKSRKLLVNGNEVSIAQKPFEFFIGVDQPIFLRNKECRFVIRNFRVDIALEGYYVTSKKKYVPRVDVPLWVWLFVLASILPFFFMMKSGTAGVIIAVLAGIACISVSISSRIIKSLKTLLCFGITAFSWISIRILFFILNT